ncbi:dual specificity protein phosphatase 3-like [Asterias rubens]|uniref:dual specificity protein phosphatase 3-like n=1 Tax=Asterias rubens TaxID=7604 RepID=UPI0014556683|nr:dual specificity protein phosphatase 3-like [Asterias rubens]
MATQDIDGTAPPESCTPKDLLEIVRGGGELVLMPSRAYDEVYPDIYISERSFATNKISLKQVGITHIVNAAQGTSKFGHVNTDEEFYKDTGISFYAIKAVDVIGFNISPFLEAASDFIDNALTNKGKVLVHCVEGFSRSTTVVIAFLMIKRNMDAREALRVVLTKREVCPNDGFMKQLCELNRKLKAEKPL